jgi:hypothetical protein
MNSFSLLNFKECNVSFLFLKFLNSFFIIPIQEFELTEDNTLNCMVTIEEEDFFCNILVIALRPQTPTHSRGGWTQSHP